MGVLIVPCHRWDDKQSQTINCYELALPLYCYHSCLGAKDTVKSFRETLVGLLMKHCCHKSTVDACDVLQCSRAVAKCGLHHMSKWLVAQYGCAGAIICDYQNVVNG